jgi:protein involved in polysaccharide export with SLBB domain
MLALIALVLAAAGIGAQTLDQAAIAQALAAQGAAQGGNAPATAAAQPTVGALTVAPGAAAQAAPAQAATVAVPVAPSAIEAMFSDMGASAGYAGKALEQFGYAALGTQAPAAIAAIGDDYLLGPGDSLVLYLWGDPVDIKEISASYTLTVDRNGSIFLPPAGQISALGQSLGSLRASIKGALDRKYRRLEMSLALSTLRQFPVFVAGYAANPGTVMATGADTVLTVLARAGGILKTGSLRSVELSRAGAAGPEKRRIDLYDALVFGAALDLRVREGDSLHVSGIGPVVALAGELRRPAIYELSGPASLAQALALAGGALPSARAGSAALLRFSDSGRAIQTGDLADAAFSAAAARDGDYLYVGRVAGTLVGQAQIAGPAKYAGSYDLASYQTLAALLRKAQPLPEANLFYGRVYRTDASGRDKSFAFAPRDVLSGSDIVLAERDRVVLYRFDDAAIDPDFDRFADTVAIAGPVKYPGFYLYKKGQTLAGLLADNALALDASRVYAEIVSRTPAGLETYATFSPEEILSGKRDIALSRLDRIRFVKRGAEAAAHDFDKFPQAVLLAGSVARPEAYALRAGMKLSALLGKDQILLDTNLRYAELKRVRADGAAEYLTFRPAEVLDGSWDLELRARDVITLVKAGYAPEKPDFDRYADAVLVAGPSRSPGLYAWRAGMKLSELLELAKPSIEVNPYYAEIARPQGGERVEYRTFAPREVAAGFFDTELQPRDVVRLFGPAVKAAPVPAPVPVNPANPANPVVSPAPAAAANPVNPVEAPAPAAAPAPNPVNPANPAYPVLDDNHLANVADYVAVSGEARYTGPYALTPGLKLSSIVSAGRLTDAASLDYAELTRRKPDGTLEYLAFAPAAVADGSYDLALKAGDAIRFVAGTAFGGAAPAVDLAKFRNAVKLSGTVARPEVYALLPGMKLSRLLGADQVLPDTNLAYAEILRLKADGADEYLTFRPAEVLDGSWDLELRAGDRISLVKAGFAPEKPDFDRFAAAVYLSGPARFPGLYAWRAGMKLSALLAQSVPSLWVNQYYAEIVRPRGGDKADILTFAPREVASGAFDAELSARDGVRLYAAAGKGTPEAAASPELSLVEELVTVSGPARYVGPYARTPSLKLSSIVVPGQLLDTANLDYAELTRRRADGSVEYLTFSPREVLAGAYDLALQAKDAVAFVAGAAFGGAAAPTNLDKYPESVQLSGSVARPGAYAYKPGLKLSQVLVADQFLLDTNLNYAEITRYRPDGKDEHLTFRPSELLSGAWDFALGARDSVRLVKVGYAPAARDLDRFADAVALSGPVRFPGLYAWREGTKLSVILALAKPLLETNQVYAEIVRPLGGDKVEYLTFAPREVAAGLSDIVLAPRDAVRLYATAPAAAAKQGAEAAPAAVPVSPAPAPVNPVLSLESAETADLGRFLEVVTVAGAARYAGPYARTASLKLSSVVTADQMLEETNLEYAELTRLRADGTLEYKAFAPRDVLEKRFDLALKARDSVRLVKKTPFGGAPAGIDVEKFANAVQLAGRAARPEVYALRNGMKLSSILTADQLLLDTNLNYAELTRLKSDGRNEYLTFSPSRVLSGEWDITLGARDVVRLVKVGYAPEKPDFDRFKDVVLLSGPALFPGLYSWNETLTLSALQELAAITLDTNQVYADITRPLPGGQSQVITFAPREVASGAFDMALAPRDTVRFYSLEAAALQAKAQAEALAQAEAPGAAGMTGAAPAAAGGAAAAPTAAPTTAAATMTAAPGAGGTFAVGAATAGPAVAAAGPAAAPAGPAGGIATDSGFYLEVVNVSGVTRYQGPYARTASLKLSSVVTRDQILQDTSLDYAELTRRRADGGWEYSAFSPREVLTGSFDLPLRAQDSIRFVKVGYLPPKPDFDHFGNAYAITGAARLPGLYALDGELRLSDIVSAEQLLSSTDVYYAEIERWVSGGRTEYQTFSPLAVLQGSQDERLFPRDIVRFVPAGDSGETHDFSRYPDAVVVKGTVRYPGRYAWYKGLTLADLVAGDDLLMDTDSGYAELRRQSAQSQAILSFSPGEVVSGKAPLALQPRDVVVFYPKFFNKPVTVSGEIAEPKVIPFFDGMELSAVLRSVRLSGDFTTLKAVITKAAGASSAVYLEEYYRRQAAQKVALDPGDSVSIKRLLPDEHLPIVTVRGAVRQPTTLAYRDGMRLADALAEAGGYDGRAYPTGLVLIRKSAAETQQKQVDRLIAQLEAASAAGAALPSSTDSTLSSAAAVVANLQIDLAMQRAKLGGLKQLYKEGFGRISLDIPATVEELKASGANVVLERDDMIFVPTTPTYVLVSGEVSDQNVVAYREGITVKQAIAESGWLTASADLPNAYIVRASGRLDSTEGKGFLFFRPNILKYRLNPGDTVVVPTKSVKVSVGWSYAKDSFAIIGTILTSALTTKTLLGL